MEYSSEQKILILFHQCVNLFSRRRESVGGFPVGQARILHILEESDGLSQKELAEKLHIRQPSLTELLRKLASGGYVTLRQNKEDKRITNVFRTGKGKKAVDGIIADNEKLASEVTAALSAREQTTLIKLLERLFASLEKTGDKNHEPHERHEPLP
jgi:DNA-binding MarR family transcriptional regulator